MTEHVEGRSADAALLLGDDLNRTKRWTAIAVGLFVLVSLFYLFGYYRPVYTVVSGHVFIYGSAAILILLAAWQASQNRGVLVSLLMCVAPVSALFIQIVAEGQGVSNPSPVGILLLGIGWGIAFGAPLGIVGYLVGRGTRKLHTSNRPA